MALGLKNGLAKDTLYIQKLGALGQIELEPNL
jgi:hypothetical protein